ncbi:hypothetical protein DTO021C3_3774 [Paecilomyces variotii]|nr:hypothetical protein DTO021C3_3774 [Paecilomyces variotii]
MRGTIRLWSDLSTVNSFQIWFHCDGWTKSADDEEPISPTGYGGVLVSATGRCLLYPWDVMLDQKLVPAAHNRTQATRLNSHPHVIDDSEDLVESHELHPKDLGHALARMVKFINTL